MARIHPEDSARVRAAVQNAQEHGMPFEGQGPCGASRRRGAVGAGERPARCLDSRIGRNPRRMGIVIDITERKRAERLQAEQIVD